MTLFEEDKKMEDEMYDNDGEPASETDFDYKDIDTMETALLVGAERIKYLPAIKSNLNK